MGINSKKVLIVDDTLSDRTLLSSTFKKAGYKVYLAENGIEGYLKFFKIKPDIILVDILLPKMRGDVLIQWLKGTALGKEIPCIVISQHTKMRDYLYQIGIEIFFQKPIKTKEVLEVAEEYLKIYEMKKTINLKIRQLRERFEIKTAKVEVMKQKICETCQTIVPVSVVNCPNCGSVHLHLVEVPGTAVPPDIGPLPTSPS